MAVEVPVPIFVFESEDGQKRACSKDVANYILKKVSAMILEKEVACRTVCDENDIHEATVIVFDSISDRLCICDGESDDGETTRFLAFSEKPEDFDIFVNTKTESDKVKDMINELLERRIK